MQLFHSSINADNTATMRVYGEIGTDITGADFASDMAALEAAGINDIEVRINSTGGSVFDGYVMFAEMLKSRANITTYNDGIAASTAGWLFLAGNQAVVADYALVMLHNPSGGSESGKGAEVLNLIRRSIITILSKRTGQSAVNVAASMDEETWYDSEKALSLGFATSIAHTPAITELLNAAVTPDTVYAVVNKAKGFEPKNTNKEMTEVTNEPTEDQAIVDAQTEPTTEPEQTEEPTTQETETEAPQEPETPQIDAEKELLKLENAELVRKLAEAETAKNELALVVNKYKEDEAAAELAKNEAAYAEVVDKAVADGRISGAAKDTWLNMARTNFELTKNSLDSLTFAGRAAVSVMDRVQSTSSGDAPVKLTQMDKKVVEDMYKNDWSKYRALYKAEFGVDLGAK